MGDTSSPLEWGVASRARVGEAMSGDEAVLVWLPDGALVAAVDGLGHGSAAAGAAAAAVELVRQYAAEPLISLIRRCHAALRTTRGAAMSVAKFAFGDDTLTWIGVGNVEGRLVRPSDGALRSEPLISTRGAVGVQLVPQLHPTTVSIEQGAMLLFATDGIAPAFADSPPQLGNAEEIAQRILRDHARATDDALVVVARYRGKAQ